MTEQEGKQENVARQTALVVGAIADPEMLQKKINGCDIIEPVSYTHLTLPTIYSV